MYPIDLRAFIQVAKQYLDLKESLIEKFSFIINNHAMVFLKSNKCVSRGGHTSVSKIVPCHIEKREKKGRQSNVQGKHNSVSEIKKTTDRGCEIKNRLKYRE